MKHDRTRRALARSHRRAQLWAIARNRFATETEFRAAWHLIAEDVAVQLREEYPDL